MPPPAPPRSFFIHFTISPIILGHFGLFLVLFFFWFIVTILVFPFFPPKTWRPHPGLPPSPPPHSKKKHQKKKRKPLIFHLFSKNSAPLWGNFLRFWLKCLGVRFNFILYISIFGVYFVHFRLFSPPPAQTRPYTPKSPPPRMGPKPTILGSPLPLLHTPQNGAKPLNFGVPSAAAK